MHGRRINVPVLLAARQRRAVERAPLNVDAGARVRSNIMVRLPLGHPVHALNVAGVGSGADDDSDGRVWVKIPGRGARGRAAACRSYCQGTVRATEKAVGRGSGQPELLPQHSAC